MISTLADNIFRSGQLPDQASTGAAATDALYMFIFWICVLSFVILMGAMLYFIIRYRRRDGIPTIRSASHNTPLELAWSVGPLLILVVVFFWGFHGYMDKVAAPVSSEEIHIIGKKWAWDISYRNGATPRNFKQIGHREYPEFVVPKGVPVKLRMTSEDVIHSFFIPDFRVKMDVFPNRYSSLWFEATEPTPADQEGHIVFCAEYCGDGHSEMMARIRVLEPDEYYATVDSWAGVDPTWTPAEQGKFFWRQKCMSCHSIDGSAGTGPTWKNLYGTERTSIDGQTTVADDEYIRTSILAPQRFIVEGYGNNMNVQNLNEKEIAAVIEFMKSKELNDNPAYWPKEGAGNGADGATEEGGAAEPAPAGAQ